MSRQPPPPPKDTNNGRNEYIPQYISAKPFYAEDLLKDTEYLSHQRAKAEQKDTINKAKWYERGRKSGPAATKYRKGACENCGAMTHKTRDCLSRPRKTGAKWSGKDIQADEVVEDVKLGWDAKRDRWNGYDVREYDSVVKDYEEMEGLRKVTASTNSKQDGDQADDETPNALTKQTDAEDDDTRYAEETDMGRTQPTSTRQLRLREDTAKYLIDLDLDSARYDPKTRSMDTTTQSLNTSKDNPNADLASEGFIRPSHDPTSDAAAFERAQRYAWESQERASASPAPASAQQPTSTSAQIAPPPPTKIHLEANPTASALLHKQHLASLASKREQQRSYLTDRYGSSTTSPSTSSTTKVTNKLKPNIPTSSSTYTTYDPTTGAPLDPTTNQPLLKPVPKSKYPEDIHPGNHSSVFGSYWRDGKWGFACCHSFVRNSWCTGEEGKRGFEEEERRKAGGELEVEVLGGDSRGDGVGDGRGELLVSRKRKADGDVNGDGEDEVTRRDGEKRSRTEEP